jgi:hypothetical protein
MIKCIKYDERKRYMVKIDDLNVSSLPFGYCEHEGDEDEDEDDGFIFPS